MSINRFLVIAWLASEKIIFCSKEEHITNSRNTRNISTYDENVKGPYLNWGIQSGS